MRICPNCGNATMWCESLSECSESPFGKSELKCGSCGKIIETRIQLDPIKKVINMKENANAVIEYWSNLIAHMVYANAPAEELKIAIMHSAFDIQDRELSEKAHELCRKYGDAR